MSPHSSTDEDEQPEVVSMALARSAAMSMLSAERQAVSSASKSLKEKRRARDALFKEQAATRLVFPGEDLVMEALERAKQARLAKEAADRKEQARIAAASAAPKVIRFEPAEDSTARDPSIQQAIAEFNITVMEDLVRKHKADMEALAEEARKQRQALLFGACRRISSAQDRLRRRLK